MTEDMKKMECSHEICYRSKANLLNNTNPQSQVGHPINNATYWRGRICLCDNTVITVLGYNCNEDSTAANNLFSAK